MAWTNVKGFNFRSTAGFVTDGTNETSDLGAAYPRSVTIDGDTFNVGWDSNITANTRDRSNTADRRMAGMVFRGNSTAVVNKWRIDLPSPGSYTIRVAMGDHDSARTILYRILDNTTALLTVGGTGITTVADGFADASGVARASEAAWISSNVALTATFASTICYVEIGDATGSAPDISAIAHFDIVQNAGSRSPDSFSSEWTEDDGEDYELIIDDFANFELLPSVAVADEWDWNSDWIEDAVDTDQAIGANAAQPVSALAYDDAWDWFA